MKKLSLLLTFMLGIVLAGCGSSAPPPIAVALSPATAQTLSGGQTVNVTATVANDSLSKGVTWTLTGAGTLSGQTGTAVTYTAPTTITASSTATVTATSVADITKSSVMTINLVAITVSVNPSTAQTLDQGTTLAVTATVTNDAASKGATWSLVGAGSLTNKTATSVTYNAPALVTTALSPVITATSVSDTTKTATVTVNLVPPPSVTTTAPPVGTVSVAYTTSLAASNGVPPYTWSVVTGTLPAGLTLAGNTISGTPTAYGTSNFTVQVKDASNLTANGNLSIKINPAPVNITTTSLPNGIVNSLYNASLQSTGGATPITWSVTAGALPVGLALAANGNITGTPTTAGTSSFTVQAADSSLPALTNTKVLSIIVIPVLTISTASLPNGISSTAYNATLQSAGGVAPVSWSVTAGALPAGLSLNASTGAITGAPTTAGTSNFTVQAADSGSPQQKVTKALSITVAQQLVITNSTLPTGAVNSLYSTTLQSSGGTPAVSWTVTIGALPAGLTLNVATGVVSGTPTTAGTATFTVQATDSGTPQQNPTKQFNIIINPALAITTTSPLPSGIVGTAYSQTLQTNGGGIAPISWSVTIGALPGGLSLNAATGVISGTPTTATGSPFNFTIKAADSGAPQQTSTRAFNISIATAPLSVATSGLPDGVVGQNYSGAMLQSGGGNPPVTWSISAGTLPVGLALNASTGAITGTPSAAGTTTFTVKATDSTTPTAQTAIKQLSIRVNSVLTITTTTLSGGTVNTPYSATLQSSGGATPIVWSITAGSLPGGLSLNPGTGVISGSPTTAATSNFTVQAMDSTSPTAQTASQAISLTISVAPLVITTTNLQNGVVNSSYNQTLQFNGGTNPVTWTISTGTLPTGLVLNATNGNISGTPTAGGTSSFTVKATDSTTPTPQSATANLSITVNSAACGTGSETLLNGQYAFLLKGFDSTPNPVLIGGVLTADGAGHFTAGTEDENLSAGVLLNLSVNLGSSSYSVGSDHRGCMTIVTTAGSNTYRFSLGAISGGVASTGHIVDFDATGPFTAGVLRKQNPTAFSTAQVTGNYAFGVSSAQNIAKGGGKFAAAGVFNFAAGAVTGGVVDVNNNGKLDNNAALTNFPASPISINSGGSYTVLSNGRGTLSFTPAGSSGAVTAVLYVVSSTDVLILGTDSQTTNSAFAGEALQQSGSPFAAASVTGNYVGYSSGLGTSSGTTSVEIFLFNSPGNGTFTVNIQSNKSGTVTSQTGLSGTDTVAATGRTLLVAGPGSGPMLYVVSPTQAFFLNSNSRVDSGFFESQTGGPFTAASAKGTYAFGTINPEGSAVDDGSGLATFDGVSAVTGISDDNSGGSLSPNGTFNQTYSLDSTGLGVLPSGCTIGTTCQTIFYVVSPTKAIVIDVRSSKTNPRIQVAEK